MASMYIVLTQTGTMISKIVRHYTRDEYNHVSISLDKKLSEMYSFGRYHPYIFFYGGFIQERVNFGTFKRFKRTTALIYEIKVSDESYGIADSIIKKFKLERKKHRFNIKGILKAKKGIEYQPNKNRFYCSQFVKYILTASGVIKDNFFSKIATPQSFADIPFAKLVYSGLLKEYK